jgi:RimJ/RimL family protein N-acetyltransferase
VPEDAEVVQTMVSERQVADTTLNIPHPYPEGGAASWIATHQTRFAAGEDAVFAVTSGAAGVLGAVGLSLVPAHRRAELGYWIGVPYWNQGFATEAGQAMLWYGFEGLALHRIQAHHFARNPASGRVMQKLGMRYEGQSRQYLMRWGEFEDVERYAMLRDEYRGPPWPVAAE